MTLKMPEFGECLTGVATDFVDGIMEVILLANDLIPHTPETRNQVIKKWMTDKHDFLFNQSPLDVCLRGDSKSLIDWMKDRKGSVF